MKKLIYLPKLVPLCPLMRSLALSSQLLPKSVIPNTAIGDVTSLTPTWTSKSRSLFGGTSSSSLHTQWALSSSLPWSQSSFIFTGSVGRRILIVVPMDTLYRTSIISSSIVLPLNPFANLSLAPLFLFSIYGPDLGVWPDCWVSAEYLHAAVPRKGSGSTTTTTMNKTEKYRLCY